MGIEVVDLRRQGAAQRILALSQRADAKAIAVADDCVIYRVARVNGSRPVRRKDPRGRKAGGGPIQKIAIEALRSAGGVARASTLVDAITATGRPKGAARSCVYGLLKTGLIAKESHGVYRLVQDQTEPVDG